MSKFVEVITFLLFWVYDVLLEVCYAVFRCRPRKEIRNKHILITGSAQGLGRLVAEQLASFNNTLHLVDYNHSLNIETAEHIRSVSGCKVFTYHTDVGDKEAVRELWGKVKENKGEAHVEYLFNIAGIVSGKSLLTTTEEEIERVIKINLLGVMYLQKAVLPDMMEHGGHVVNVSSLGGIVAGSHLTPYVASKFGVRGATLAMQSEMDYHKSTHVKFTCVMPHITKTGLFNNVQAKWPLVFPLLEPQWVADQIVIAAREERDQVILPKVSLLFMTVEHLMSARVWRVYSDLMGSHLMKTFVKIRPQ